MPKRVEKARLALISSALEIEKTELDAKININSPDQMKMSLEEENKLLKSMVDKIESLGANVLICQKGLDDIAQHYLAKVIFWPFIESLRIDDVIAASKSIGGPPVGGGMPPAGGMGGMD